MKKHNGMRPQDIVVILAILASTKKYMDKNESKEGNSTNDSSFILANKSIAQQLHLSESEVSESLYRSKFSGLIDDIKLKKVNKRALLEFLLYQVYISYSSKWIRAGNSNCSIGRTIKKRTYF